MIPLSIYKNIIADDCVFILNDGGFTFNCYYAYMPNLNGLLINDNKNTILKSHKSNRNVRSYNEYFKMFIMDENNRIIKKQYFKIEDVI